MGKKKYIRLLLLNHINLLLSLDKKVYGLVGGDDALTKYTDEDILVLLKNMSDKLKYLDRKK